MPKPKTPQAEDFTKYGWTRITDNPYNPGGWIGRYGFEYDAQGKPVEEQRTESKEGFPRIIKKYKDRWMMAEPGQPASTWIDITPESIKERAAAKASAQGSNKLAPVSGMGTVAGTAGGAGRTGEVGSIDMPGGVGATSFQRSSGGNQQQQMPKSTVPPPTPSSLPFSISEQLAADAGRLQGIPAGMQQSGQIVPVMTPEQWIAISQSPYLPPVSPDIRIDTRYAPVPVPSYDPIAQRFIPMPRRNTAMGVVSNPYLDNM